MVIAVNTRLLLKNRLEGIGVFTYETLKRITRAHPEHRFIFIFDRPYDESFLFSDNIIPVVAAPPARHPFLWFLWFEWSIPRILRKYKADLFLSTDGYLSLRTPVRSVNVIHDINFVHRPEDLPWLYQKYFNRWFPAFASKAIRIATVSMFSAADLTRTWGVNHEKIDIVYNGCSDLFRPADANKITRTRSQFTDGFPYFIFVGALHPRKNIDKLLEAYDLFRSQSPEKVKLVIAGGAMFRTGTIHTTYNKMKFRDDVIFTGRVESSVLADLMASSLGLVFVPLYEGFGIPLIEAMNCDVPVVASDVTSLPEVCGEAALYVNPLSADSIAGAMVRIAGEPDLRDSLIAAGRIRKTRYSWERSSRLLWETIMKATE
jgi:glycosyltransferase involved in cell wall biosynthesis